MKSNSYKAQVSLFMRASFSASRIGGVKPALQKFEVRKYRQKVVQILISSEVLIIRQGLNKQAKTYRATRRGLLILKRVDFKADSTFGSYIDSIIQGEGLVNPKQRNKRLRLLIRKLNQERKRQAKKIDILCNDLIAAQRDFIKRLSTIGFAANFYEAIAGTTELSNLILVASRLIKGETGDASVTFFLRQGENFEMHIFKSDQPILLEKQGVENCFTREAVDNICKSNKICTLDDMFKMGLQGNLTRLNEISATTIPLSQLGRSLGFILIYRSAQEKLTADELNNVAAISPGLSRAIASCRVLPPWGASSGCSVCKSAD